MEFADIVSTLGLLQGVLLGAIIFFANRPDRPTRLLGLFVLTLSLRILPFLLIRLPYGQAHPAVLFLPFYFWYLSVPLLYLYTRRLTDRLDWRRDWVHLTPGLIEIGLFGTAFLLEALGAQPLFDADTRTGIIGVHGILSIVPAACYAYLTLRTLHRHRSYILSYYSNLDGKRLRWIRNALLAIIGLAITYLLFRFGPLPLPLPVCIVYGAVVNTLIIYYVSLNGIRQLGLKHVASREMGAGSRVQSAPEAPQGHPPVPIDEQSDYAAAFQKIERHLTERKDYLDPQLTIADLAGRLHLSERTLSRIINSESGEHFNGYINHYRVQAAYALLGDPAYDHYNMEGIAAEAGFNNKTTFYQAFKRDCAVSPAVYRRTRQTTPSDP